MSSTDLWHLTIWINFTFKIMRLDVPLREMSILCAWLRRCQSLLSPKKLAKPVSTPKAKKKKKGTKIPLEILKKTKHERNYWSENCEIWFFFLIDTFEGKSSWKQKRFQLFVFKKNDKKLSRKVKRAQKGSCCCLVLILCDLSSCYLRCSELALTLFLFNQKRCLCTRNILIASNQVFYFFCGNIFTACEEKKNAIGAALPPVIKLSKQTVD